MMWIYAFAGFLVIAVLMTVLERRLASRKMSSADKRKFLMQWEHVRSIQDLHRRVLEADKVLSNVIEHRGESGNFIDNMIAVSHMLRNEQSVWDAHKLRNRIAHEAGITITESQAKRAVKAYEKALQSLL